MAKEMFSFRIDSGLRDALALRALAESRSVSNMAEVLLEAALTERGVGDATHLLRPAAEARVAPAAPRSVSPADVELMAETGRRAKEISDRQAVTAADVAATIPGVSIVRPHMKKNRPAVECPTRWPSGSACPDCGQTVT